MLYDKDIREPLFLFLENEFGRVRIFEEMVIGRARADIVMLTDGALTGIEIKSDADTYSRLPGQVTEYDRYFDYNIAVVGTCHALGIEERVPPHWGIITVEESDFAFADFYVLRRPKPNPNMAWDKKLSLMWRPELNELLRLNLLPAYVGRSKAFVIASLAKFAQGLSDTDGLKLQISEILFERDYTTIAEEINAYRQSIGRRPRRKIAKKRRKRRV